MITQYPIIHVCFLGGIHWYWLAEALSSAGNYHIEHEDYYEFRRTMNNPIHVMKANLLFFEVVNYDPDKHKPWVGDLAVEEAND